VPSDREGFAFDGRLGTAPNQQNPAEFKPVFSKSCSTHFSLSRPSRRRKGERETPTACCHDVDLSTAAGRLQLHILSALGEFERARLIERTKAGLTRARRQGTRLGPRPVRLTQAQLAAVVHLPVKRLETLVSA
jgi:hypothetical protein